MLGLCGLGHREGTMTEDPTLPQAQDLQGRRRKEGFLEVRSLQGIWQWAGFPGVASLPAAGAGGVEREPDGEPERDTEN